MSNGGTRGDHDESRDSFKLGLKVRHANSRGPACKIRRRRTEILRQQSQSVSQFLQIDRLGQIPRRAFVKRLFDRTDSRVSRHHDNSKAGRMLRHLLQQGQAVTTAELDVQKRDIHPVVLQKCKGFIGAHRRMDFVAALTQLPLEQSQKVFFIIDDQHGLAQRRH